MVLGKIPAENNERVMAREIKLRLEPRRSAWLQF
jgi:hypothetical protein